MSIPRGCPVVYRIDSYLVAIYIVHLITLISSALYGLWSLGCDVSTAISTQRCVLHNYKLIMKA
jgi:hypothetical protein